MLSLQQSYSRLFRPWDVSAEKKEKIEDEKKKDKRENRLRKIRGSYKKPIDQDSTISTTTVEDIESPVTSLTECCDRLLQETSEKQKKPSKPSNASSKTIKHNTSSKAVKVQEERPAWPQFAPPPEILPITPDIYPSYVPELLTPTDLVQSLGLHPADPLLLESLAQGYAMEMEYARIMHEENQAKLLNSRKQRPKKYKCPHCQVGFSNNGQLKGHIRIHTGERPFKCDDKNCGKTFTRNEELTRHKRIHSGIRPYPCPSCGKKFGRRDHLKKHTRTHLIQAERMMPVFLPLSAVPHASYPYIYGY